MVSAPAINARLAQLGVDACMVPLNVPPQALASFWNLLRASESYIGCSVTYPPKQMAFKAADSLSDRAKRLGAVNTLRRNFDRTLCGDATDGLALVAAMKHAGIDLEGSSVHVIGAGGGAGRAIVDAFCAAGVQALRLEDSCHLRADETDQMMRAAWPDAVAATDISCDVLVDATANGKSANQAQLFAKAEIEMCSVACDIAAPRATSQFLQQATASGSRTIDATEMGDGQVDAQLDVWLQDALMERNTWA